MNRIIFSDVCLTEKQLLGFNAVLRIMQSFLGIETCPLLKSDGKTIYGVIFLKKVSKSKIPHLIDMLVCFFAGAFIENVSMATE